nr:DUF2231 domain-containing protein [Armatimonadota bacterium]
MKSKAAVGGHPIHPMAVSFPIGLLISSLTCDVIGLVTKNKKWNETGYKMMVGGLIGGVGAAIPGAIDYLAVIPPGSEAEDTGRKHALANVAMLGLFGANAVMRAQGGSIPLS